MVAPLLHGQSLSVLGSANSFGASVAANAVRLYTTPEAYPVWYTLDPLVVPRGVQVVYRYGVSEAGQVQVFEKDKSVIYILF